MTIHSRCHRLLYSDHYRCVQAPDFVTYFDVNYYDSVLRDYHLHSYLTKQDNVTSMHFDEALCDQALVDALRLRLGMKTVEPEVTTHFDTRLFDDYCELHASKSKFERTYGRPTTCLLYTSPSPRDLSTSRMPSSA